MSSGRTLLPWALASSVLAVLWFWPTLAFGFRSDDFLLSYYADPAGGASWDRAFAEFGRPWFRVRDLYRPLVSVSHAACFEFGTEPLPFRLFNLLVLSVTAAAAGGIASLLAPLRPVLAAAVACAVVVFHPASVETAAWIAARTSGLEAMFTTLTAYAYLRRFRGERATALLEGVASSDDLAGSGVAAAPRAQSFAATAAAALFAAMALASKEGAVAMPALLLAVDMAVRPSRPWRERARRLWPFVALVAIYFFVRISVLGVLTTADDTHSAWSQAEASLLRAVSWFAPPDAEGGAQWVTMVAFLALAGTAPTNARRKALLVAGGGLALLVPTSLLYEPVGLMSGRLVFPAVPALAVAFSVMLVSAVDSIGSRRWFAWAAATIWIAAAGLMSRTWIASFGSQDAEIAEVRRGLEVAAAGAAPGKPCALSMLPALPLLQPHMWGVLGAPPFAARDHGLVSLAGVLSKDVTSPGLFGDVALAHALSELGGGSLSWDPRLRKFRALARPSVGEADLAATGEPGVFASASSLPATAYAAIQVDLDEPAAAVSLSLRDDFAGEWAFGAVTQRFDPPSRSATFDLTHSIAPLLRAGNGGSFSGVRVDVDGAPMQHGRVRALASIPTTAPDATTNGSSIAATELAAALVPPRRDLPLRLYLMSPLRTICVDVPAGRDPILSAFELDKFELAAGVVDGCPVHWLWQTPPGFAGAPWRSGIHWRRLR